MASGLHPAAVAESKTSKKKKAKASQRTESPAASAKAAAPSEKTLSVAPNEANGDAAEPAFIRELAKTIRNINKKITNASKTDDLIAEHKDKTLDELVSLRLINADQKAQHLKKPALQAQLAQLEEQHAQFKKLDADYRQRLAADKAETTKTLTDKYEQEKADAVREVQEKTAAEAKKTLHDSFLTLSQFLRLAASRRAEDQNPQLDENLALEGVLLQVYSGDENGVNTMLKLVEGSEEATKSVSNDPLQTTFAQVKAVSAAFGAPLYQAEAEETVEEVVETVESAPVQSDPTVITAGLTEIDSGADTAYVETAKTNGETAEPSNADVADEAANAAAENQWDANNGSSKDLTTPAAATNTQSWADEQPDEHPPKTATETAEATPAHAAHHGHGHSHAHSHPAPATAPGTDSDGFHQVQRHRGRNDRDGNNNNNWRGRGGFRGRGRGEGRGRGRGGRGRGGNGNGNGDFHRNQRRNEETA